MEPALAARLLGLPAHWADDGAAAEGPARRAVRSAYLRRLRELHPDRNPAPDANSRTTELREAYDCALAVLATWHSPSRPLTPGPGVTTPGQRPTAPTGRIVWLVDDESIALDAPRHDAMLALIEAAGDLGEITYLDPSAGMIQVVIEFLDAPTAQILMTMQGRGDSTEVLCCVDPFNGGPLPEARPVVSVIADRIAGYLAPG